MPAQLQGAGYVERAVRSLKTIDLKARPIHQRTAGRPRAHISLCLLAYYVKWHLREAWRELLLADSDQATKVTRYPVEDGTPAHSFATLLGELAIIVRTTCRALHAGPNSPTFEVITNPNAKQQPALELLQQVRL